MAFTKRMKEYKYSDPELKIKDKINIIRFTFSSFILSASLLWILPTAFESIELSGSFSSNNVTRFMVSFYRNWNNWSSVM